MNNLLKLEEAAQFGLAVLGLYFQPIQFSWWLWPVIFLAPDLSMVGYLINTKVGAALYNLVHHKLLAVIVFGVGFVLANQLLVLCGLVLFGHSAFDRIMGYGLKHADSFKHTHLGWM